MYQDSYRRWLESFERATGEPLLKICFDGLTATGGRDRMHQLHEEIQHHTIAIDHPLIQAELDRPFLNDNAPDDQQRLRFTAWSKHYVAWWSYDGEMQVMNWVPARPKAPTEATNTLALMTTSPNL